MTDIRKMSKREIDELNLRMMRWRERNRPAQIPPVQMDFPICTDLTEKDSRLNKIYLASRYGRRDELCTYRAQLQALGFTVTSRWLDGNHHMPDHCPTDYQHAENERFAREDSQFNPRVRGG